MKQYWVSNDNVFTPDFNCLRLQLATVNIILPGLLEQRLESASVSGQMCINKFCYPITILAEAACTTALQPAIVLASSSLQSSASNTPRCQDQAQHSVTVSGHTLRKSLQLAFVSDNLQNSRIGYIGRGIA